MNTPYRPLGIERLGVSPNGSHEASRVAPAESATTAMFASAVLAGAVSTAYAAAAAILVVLATAASATAAPVNYQESVSGELPVAGSPLTTFTLDSGDNTVSGTITVGSADGTSDWDSFAIVVPAGMQLTAGSISLVDVGSDFDTAIWELRAGSADFGGGTFLETVAASSPGGQSLTTVPLGPGTYHFAHTIVDGFTDPASANYTFTLSVVPEPTSLSLLLPLIGIALASARRARDASPGRTMSRRRERRPETGGGMSRAVTAAMIALGGAAVSGDVAQAAVAFTPLGVSGATGISADGSTVVGAAGRWTAAGGWQDLGPLPGATAVGGARAASADGSVVVGTSVNAAGAQEGFRWTAATGKVGLGVGPEFSRTSAWSVSYDGSVIAGRGVVTGTSTGRALRWTAATGWTLLPGFPDATVPHNAQTWAVSGDGSVIVGQAYSHYGPLAAVRWSPAGDVSHVWLVYDSTAQAVSADGSVIVGVGGVTALSETLGYAFRYSDAGGWAPLTASGTWSRANAVSADGSVVVGRSLRLGVDADWNATIWDATGQMLRLDDVLAGGGLDLTGWTLTNAVGISADGLTVVGTGTNSAGQSESWVATIPEPAPLCLVPVAAAAAMFRRRALASRVRQRGGLARPCPDGQPRHTR